MSGSRASLLALLLAAAPAAAAERPLLGASLYGAKDGFKGAAALLERMKGEGFRFVSFVPTYPYVDLDRVDFAGGPAWSDLEAALGAALDGGFTVVVKPHLDPPIHIWGYQVPDDARTWRKDCPWRGYFDVDPMSEDYREGLLGRTLGALARVLAARPSAGPVRLELGAELMNSMAYTPGRWVELLAWAKKERRRLGLEGRVLLSYNYEHHFEIPGDFVKRLSPQGRKDAARFLKGLDAFALSQYMDLTVAMPAADRGKRLPTADEVADALVLHEVRLRGDILERELGLKPSEVPPLHIGEFGVGRGGLARPNEWSGDATPEEEARLALEIARGHEGLARYLSRTRGRTALTGVLWTLGKRYDVFGWGDPAFAIPAAAEASRAYLQGR